MHEATLHRLHHGEAYGGHRLDTGFLGRGMSWDVGSTNGESSSDFCGCECSLWLCQNSENDPVEIVDFPIENGGSFHRFLYVHQAGYPRDRGTLWEIHHFSMENPTESGTHPWDEYHEIWGTQHLRVVANSKKRCNVSSK